MKSGGNWISIQTRKASLFEAVMNITVGYGVALLSQTIIFPVFGFYASLKTHLWIGFWFTIISLIRSYALRRIFNAISERAIHHGMEGRRMQ